MLGATTGGRGSDGKVRSSMTRVGRASSRRSSLGPLAVQVDRRDVRRRIFCAHPKASGRHAANRVWRSHCLKSHDMRKHIPSLAALESSDDDRLTVELRLTRLRSQVAVEASSGPRGRMTRPSPWRGAMIKLVPLCAPLLLAGCEGRSLPPVSPAPPAASAAEPHDAGAAETQGETKGRDDLKGDLAAVDAALTDLNKRLAVARDAVKADLQQQVATLQKRDEALKAQLKAFETRADAEADKARREIHRAIVDLKSDMQHVADRLRR
jgi:hypothetical protein